MPKQQSASLESTNRSHPRLRVLCVASLLLVIAAISTGCVVTEGFGAFILPTLNTGEAHGQHLRTADAAFIHPERTTRDEVFCRLGTNYLSIDDKRAIAYSWNQPGVDLSLVGMVVNDVDRPEANREASWSILDTTWRALFIAFGPDAKVRAIRFKYLSSSANLHSQLAQWEARLPRVNGGPHSLERKQ